jgi:hypothetical protein
MLIFHVYGSHIEYENIGRRVRERTCADILLQTDHITSDTSLTEETDRVKLSPAQWDPWINHVFLPAKAQKKNTGSPVDIRFTAKGNSIYAICLAWPEKDVLVSALGNKGVPDKTIAAVSMLGSKDEVKWRQTDDGLILSVPREKPCRYAFVYRIDFKKE